jgi:CxxC-x17-CxxC domain-containing protein
VTFQDKSLTCVDCGATFVHSAEDQEFFQTKGYTNEPKRCPECRQSRKAERYGSGARQMYPATCAQCGKATEVPFQPRGDKPVYCNDCFRQMRQTK